MNHMRLLMLIRDMSVLQEHRCPVDDTLFFVYFYMVWIKCAGLKYKQRIRFLFFLFVFLYADFAC